MNWPKISIKKIFYQIFLPKYNIKVTEKYRDGFPKVSKINVTCKSWGQREMELLTLEEPGGNRPKLVRAYYTSSLVVEECPVGLQPALRREFYSVEQLKKVESRLTKKLCRLGII